MHIIWIMVDCGWSLMLIAMHAHISFYDYRDRQVSLVVILTYYYASFYRDDPNVDAEIQCFLKWIQSLGMYIVRLALCIIKVPTYQPIISWYRWRADIIMHPSNKLLFALWKFVLGIKTTIGNRVKQCQIFLLLFLLGLIITFLLDFPSSITWMIESQYSSSTNCCCQGSDGHCLEWRSPWPGRWSGTWLGQVLCLGLLPCSPSI